MNILLLGSGGREHAFAKKLSESPHCEKLFIAPGNAGTLSCGENIAIATTDFDAVKTLVIKQNILMVVVGPEDPLVKGIVDFFLGDNELKSIPVIGPDAAGAKLEGSKAFSKAFMQRNNIPTAAYKSFTVSKIDDANKFIDSLKPPYVLKASGLAAGKGVLILDEADEAKAELKAMLFNEKFGEAGHEVVIEEFLKGIEVSVFVLTDGKNYLLLPEAKDYKRIGNGDTGLNTGGMGAVSPVPFVTKDFLQKVEEKIVKPTITGLQKENINYKGFIFIGLMKVNDEPLVIEYNCRMGDPETEVVLPRIKTDLVEIFNAVANQTLDKIKLEIDSQTAATVMMVSGGYPGNYEKGFEITGLDNVKESIVFHAGTSMDETKSENSPLSFGEELGVRRIITSGGRVLAVTSLANTLEEALEKSYRSAKHIHFDYEYYRKDIGQDLLALQQQ